MQLLTPELKLYSFGFVIVAILFLLVWLIVRQIKKNADIRKISQTIRTIGSAHIEDVIIPDEIDGYVTVDYCVLTSNGIVAILMQNYTGNLFGGDVIDSWTQVYNHKSYQFDNPLRHREKCLIALQEYMPHVPVMVQVVFADSGYFPKGKPSHVSMLSDLQTDVNALLQTAECKRDKIKTAWRKLEALKWSDSAKGRSASITTS